MFSYFKNIKNPLLTSLSYARGDLKGSSLAITKITSSLCHSTVPSIEKNEAIPKEIISDGYEVEAVDKLYRLIEVEVRGNDPAVLKSYKWYAQTAAHHLGIEVGKSWNPVRPHHERYTVLRSIHVNKKCRVQYEFRTYFQFMQFHKMTGSTADTFLEYIQRNLPEGVAMKVTKFALETVPDHIKVPDKEELQIEAN